MSAPTRSMFTPESLRTSVMNETPWQGYLRSDGRKGIRNVILVVYTVECASFVAHAIGRDEDGVHVIGFPGCYDNQYAIRMILALGRHPNVGAVLTVGLGCEYTQPSKIAQTVRESGRPAASFFIQENGGTTSSIALGKQKIAQLREEMLKQVQLVPMSWSDLESDPNAADRTEPQVLRAIQSWELSLTCSLTAAAPPYSKRLSR